MLDTIETISAKQFCFVKSTADPFLCIFALEARYRRRGVVNAHACCPTKGCDSLSVSKGKCRLNLRLRR